MAWLLLGLSASFENQEQTAQQNDFKSFEFGQKGGCNKSGALEDGVEKNLVAEKININNKPSVLEQDSRKNALKECEEQARLHPLQAQNCKGKRLRREPQGTMLQNCTSLGNGT